MVFLCCKKAQEAQIIKTMEDYIYILLGIGWIVYSIYKRSQKQASKNRQQSSAPKYDSPKSLLQELLSGEKFEPLTVETEYPEHPYSSDIDDEQKYNFSKDLEETSLVENINYEEKQSLNVKRKIQNIEIAEEENEISSIDLNDFDLRKAVIYSEVLKRPYS